MGSEMIAFLHLRDGHRRGPGQTAVPETAPRRPSWFSGWSAVTMSTLAVLQLSHTPGRVASNVGFGGNPDRSVPGPASVGAQVDVAAAVGPSPRIEAPVKIGVGSCRRPTPFSAGSEPDFLSLRRWFPSLSQGIPEELPLVQDHRPVPKLSQARTLHSIPVPVGRGFRTAPGAAFVVGTGDQVVEVRIPRRVRIGDGPLALVEGGDPLAVGQAHDGSMGAIGEGVSVDDDVPAVRGRLRVGIGLAGIAVVLSAGRRRREHRRHGSASFQKLSSLEWTCVRHDFSKSNPGFRRSATCGPCSNLDHAVHGCLEATGPPIQNPLPRPAT